MAFTIDKASVKRFAGFPLEEKYRAEVEHSLARSAYKAHRIVALVIIAFQLIMTAFSLAKNLNALFRNFIPTAYFLLYITLIAVSVLTYLIGNAMIKRNTVRADRAYLLLQVLYGVLIIAWGTCISLLDQYGIKGTDVFAYCTMGVAAFVLMKPYQSLIVFMCDFAALNSLLPLTPSGTENFSAHFINSLFICVLSLVISVVVYRSRISGIYDKLIIEKKNTKIIDMNNKLNLLVLTDELTGMYNRRYLDKVSGYADFVESELVSGLMIDIDFFKKYNDTFGHTAGDACLRGLSKVINEFMAGKSGCSVRCGGEEFFVCLYGSTPEYAQNSAHELCKKVSEEIKLLAGVRSGITISVGIYTCSPDKGLDELYKKADLALYAAKKRGRNRVETYSPDMDKSSDE